MATIGRINTIISTSTKPLTSGLSRASVSIKGFGATLGGMVTTLGPVTAAIGGLAAVTSSLSKGFKDVAAAEQAEIAFTTVLGSAEKAKAVLADVRDFAASTPFELPQLTNAARQLAAFGVESENIVPSLRRIGDISAGIGAPIDEIAELYGKAKVQGRLFGEDINQLTGRGIPIIGELAKQFGVSESKVKKLVEQGKVGFPQLQSAFVAMTSEGGKFGGLMDAQSRSLSGMFSTLKDNVSLVFQDIAGVLLNAFDFKGAISNITNFTTSVRTTIQKISPVVKGAVNAIRAYFGVFEKIAKTVFGGISLGGKGTFDSIIGFAVDYYSTVEWVFKNFDRIAAFAFESTALKAVTFWENLKHLFSNFPTILTWFGDNWRDVFKTIFDFTTTVFINLGKNIRSAMKQIWDFIKSGGRKSLKFTWTPLTEGFKTAVKELPDIPDRALTELEKTLAISTKQMGDDLHSSFGEHIAARRTELLGDGVTEKVPEVALTNDKLNDASKMLNDSVQKLGEFEGVAAIQRGSGDAFSAIFKAMRGESNQDKVLKENEKQTKALNTAVAELKKANHKPQIDLVAGTV